MMCLETWTFCGICGHVRERKAERLLDAAACSPSSDTPETDALWNPIRGSAFWANHPARLLSEKLERERNAWKANHDNQVAIKRIIAARPDLQERAPMVEKLMAERNRAQAHSIRQHETIQRLEAIIQATKP